MIATATELGFKKLAGFFCSGLGATYTVTVTPITGVISSFRVMKRPISGTTANVAGLGGSSGSLSFIENNDIEFELEVWCDVKTVGTFTITSTSTGTGQGSMIASYEIDENGNIIGLISPSGSVIPIQKTNIPEIALSRYRAIPKTTQKKIAWVGDSTTLNMFVGAISSYYHVLDANSPSSDLFVVTDISGGSLLTSSTAHGLIVGGLIRAVATGNGLTINTDYFVESTPSTTTFTLSSYPAKTPMSALTNGTGLTFSMGSRSYSQALFGYVNSPIYATTHGQFWVNGGTLASFAAGTSTTGNNISDVVAYEPDLIILSYGINDVRLGTTTQTQIETYLESVINSLQSQLPYTDIILRIPATLCADAATLATYVSPATATAAKDYSNRLYNAYMNMIGRFSSLYVLDLMIGEHQMFPKIVQTTKGIYMNDALHPTAEANAAILRETMLLLGDYGNVKYPIISTGIKPLVADYTPALSAQATAVNANDYLVSPRVLEDKTKYNLIYEGKWGGGVAGSYMDVGTNNSVNSTNYTGCQATNDVIAQYFTSDTTAGSQGESIENGIVAWKRTSGSASTSGSNIRFLTVPAGYPHTQSAGIVRVYRSRPTTQKNNYDDNFAVSLVASDFTAQTINYTVQKFGVCGVLSANSTTANTTGGTLTIQKNGTTFATMTFANGATTSTGSGTFFTDGTRGIVFSEGDIISVVINAGFVGGTFPIIKFSNI